VALSEDQKAMLRLLAQRGEQGYEDIAALKGIGVDEVRAQVRDAVEQLEDEGLPPPALPTDALGPETSTEKPAEAETVKPESPAPPPPAPEPPVKAPEPPGPAPAAARDEQPKRAKPRIAIPSDPGLRGAIVAVALIVVALIVVVIVSGGNGGSDSTGTTASNASESGTETPVTNSTKITKAVLESVDGGDAAGTVIFGRVKNKLALQVLATGLEPTPNDQAYAIWLSQSPQRMLPLAATPVGKTGKIAAQFEVPVEVLGYLANETFKDIAITRVEKSRLESTLAEATKAKESPEYTGTEVLRGEVTGPIVGAANRKEAE
jgi:hypothetical protein